MEKLTYGEAYEPAMEITDQEEADRYFLVLVGMSMKNGQSREEAEKIQRENLGYYAGYYDSETRARVEKLFNCAHPIFGPISQGEPTAEEAFEIGRKLGEQALKEKPK